jgi:hypothetical protein
MPVLYRSQGDVKLMLDHIGPELEFELKAEVGSSRMECRSRPSADFRSEPELQFKTDVDITLTAALFD